MYLPANLRQSEQFKAARRVLDDEGIRFEVKSGGKHHRMSFDIDGILRSFILSSSPSDRRAGVQARADVRRIIRLAREKAVARG